MAGIELDFTELSAQARAMNNKLMEILATVEKTIQDRESGEEEPSFAPEPPDEEGLSAADRQRLERLFDQARKDRSKAYELKQELDRLHAFKEYEDRFLDLFKKKA
jgi:hypothetical protein